MTARQQLQATALAVLLLGLASTPVSAQESCPCFSEADVRAVFPGNILPREEIGRVACSAEDFDVEFMAEVTVWDSAHNLVSQARVRFFDYDTSDCLFLNQAQDPVNQNELEWPQPAPEDVARACYETIIFVARELDSTGDCYIYP
jgi:hypothetical protein